jgi:RNA polymerase sigma-70 factor (ECF subfamily)
LKFPIGELTGMADNSITEVYPERFRHYLTIVAQVNLDHRLRAKLDASDIVQQTLLQAHQSIKDFRGTTDGEMAAWLRQILVRILAHTVRDFGRDKRNIAREVNLAQQIDQTTLHLERVLAANQSSPSLKASRNESWLRLVEALNRLPESQRDVVGLYYLEECGISEISQRMGKSPVAVAGLLKRGLRKLRESLGA